MREDVVRALGVAAAVLYGSLIVWIYARQPESFAQVRGGVAAGIGAYRVDPPYRTWWEVETLHDNPLLVQSRREPTFAVEEDGLVRIPQLHPGLRLQPVRMLGDGMGLGWLPDRKQHR